MTHPERGTTIIFEGKPAIVVCCYLNSISIEVDGNMINVTYDRIK